MKVKEESENPGLKLNNQKLRSWQTGKQWKQRQTVFSWAPKSLQMVIAAMKMENTCSSGEML